jgi:hypothetical protein
MFATAASYEEPETVPANTLIPAEMVVGERYKVVADVATDGLLTRALIESEFGLFEAVGPGMLKIRLHEVEALARLEELESSDEFQKGAQQSFDEKVDAFKQLADKPEETADGIGDGVSRFFKRVKRSAKTGIQTASDVLNDETPGASQGGGGENLPGASIKRRVMCLTMKLREQVKGAVGRICPARAHRPRPGIKVKEVKLKANTAKPQKHRAMLR